MPTISHTPRAASPNGSALPAVAPELVGISPEALPRMCSRLVERGMVMHSLLVLRGGRIAFERYAAPFTRMTPHRLYSISKSFVSLAVGTLADDGLLRLDDLAADMLRSDLGPVAVHPWIAGARIRDLLTMTSPHMSTTYKRTEDTDWVRTFFTMSPGKPPGTTFAYDTSATVVLTAIVECLTGQRIADHLRDRVLEPIGFEGPFRSLMTPRGLEPGARRGAPTWREVEHNDAGVSHGGSGFFCTPRDLARFALLCLHEGNWGGRQVVSSEYVRAATSYQVSTASNPDAHPDGRQGYGYQFWRTRHGGFAALGMGGQVALCVPGADLVVVATGDNQAEGLGGHPILDIVWDELLPAIDGVDPSTASASLDAVAPVSTHPAPVMQGSWAFASGDTDVVSASVRTLADSGTLTLVTATGSVREIPFGIGSFREHELPGYGYPARSAGAWVDARTLHVRTEVTGDFLARIEFTLGLRCDAASLVMHRSAEFFADEYSGTASGRRQARAVPSEKKNPDTSHEDHHEQ